MELFVFPGTFIAGITGAVLMLVALVMGMVDMYPGTPALPTLPQLQLPLRDLSLAVGVSFVLALILARFLAEDPALSPTRLANGQRRQFRGRAGGATGSAHRPDRRGHLPVVSRAARRGSATNSSMSSPAAKWWRKAGR